MKHRIRSAALVVRDARLLLVHHFEKRTGADYWLPPGGGLEPTDHSVFDCAVRETMEETGVRVVTSRILYVREFVDHAYEFRNVEFFMIADFAEGEASVQAPCLANHDFPVVAEVGWFTKEMMQHLTVFPDCLKSEFWVDLSADPIVARHLGTWTREKSSDQGHSGDAG